MSLLLMLPSADTEGGIFNIERDQMRELLIVAGCVVIGYGIAGGINKPTSDAITEDRQQCEIDDKYTQEYIAALRPEYRFHDGYIIPIAVE